MDVQLATSDLSSFYFDVIKDRLYCDQPDSHRRRSAQVPSDSSEIECDKLLSLSFLLFRRCCGMHWKH